MAFCNSCGASMTPGTRFCNKCGAAVLSSSPAPAGTAPVAAGSAPPPVPAPTSRRWCSEGYSDHRGRHRARRSSRAYFSRILRLARRASRPHQPRRKQRQGGNPVRQRRERKRSSGSRTQSGSRHLSRITDLEKWHCLRNFRRHSHRLAHSESTDSLDKVCSFYKAKFPNAMVGSSEADQCTIISNDQEKHDHH